MTATSAEPLPNGQPVVDDTLLSWVLLVDELRDVPAVAESFPGAMVLTFDDMLDGGKAAIELVDCRDVLGIVPCDAGPALFSRASAVEKLIRADAEQVRIVQWEAWRSANTVTA